MVDPFAGGGSIPLEALRLGCETFASDLNPVACLILKVMLEDIPRHGPGLADELRRVGKEIKAKAEKELADLYPKDPDGATPIAYLWARTVRCEAPKCGAEIPLMRSMWLSKKATRRWALRTKAIGGDGDSPSVEFEIFEPASDMEVASGTVSRARATCLHCGVVLPPERVRNQLATQRGGADAIFDEQGKRVGGARMTAVVTLIPGEPGRNYRLPTDDDYVAVREAQARVSNMLQEWERGGRQGLCPVPDEPTPTGDTHRAVGSQIPLYNMTQWSDLFSARQRAVLAGLAHHINKTGEPVQLLSAIALNRTADGSASLSSWLASGEEVKHVFARQAIPMVWDFGESNYLAGASRTWISATNSIAEVVKNSVPTLTLGQAHQADATNHPLPDQSASIWFTDPPYYDAIPYADLSDFFLVWLKRTLPDHPLLQDPFDPNNALSPKAQEVVQCEKVQDALGSPKNRAFYEERMGRAFAEGRRLLSDDGIGSIVFAHKTTEGWEALLSGIIRGGWTITGSWPIATEMGSRLNAHDTASLATSIHLICRPRPEDAPVGEWADVLSELPQRVGDWMQRLQGEGVRGADLVFACVGPALEVYSRYSRVETAEGRDVALPDYLERVWEVVGREALQQVLGTVEAQARNGAAGALEEDARLTSLFLWTLQSTSETRASVDAPAETPPIAKVAESRAEYNAGGDAEPEDSDEEEAPRRRASGYSLPFDVVRRFAQPLGIHLDDWDGRVVKTEKGVVKLIPILERGRQLFGESGADALADEFEYNAASSPQLSLFPEEPPAVRGRPRRRDRGVSASLDDPEARRDATTLDRVHAAMLLQASGRSQALRNLLRAEQERGPDFLRLANALSALYPRGSEEKRLLDAMLLAAPR